MTITGKVGCFPSSRSRNLVKEEGRGQSWQGREIDRRQEKVVTDSHDGESNFIRGTTSPHSPVGSRQPKNTAHFYGWAAEPNVKV